MLNKLSNLFKSGKPSAEQQYMQQQQIQFDSQQGYIVDGIVMNDLSERLEYFSNRKLSSFNDLEQLYLRSMLINEKIDLEMATGRYIQRLGNNHENLQQFKSLIEKLNQYYREFKRDK
ncbi:hypothetical protein N7574_09495 [Acinetobacter ursingii]|uniref:hypothetical protein n=1 Tax=Acinetobacter TaxID=469 RepID=UPI000E6AC3A9|nr:MULTISPECIES: hypothetical protein [Acinetobacter]MDG9949560.1 hypothetical protein [Acinetobacter ursingii]MDH2103031.1 hypothetical protein [Acinetobacter ursingii]MEC6126362.1 hypothetical protein [Acinetobacter ursingii]RSC24118.1 hypothetical protein EGS47_15900 [Acinetobacter sp. FDAARGOS_515]